MITDNTTNITSNSSSISSIQATNTIQDNSISNNTNDISSNTSDITAIQAFNTSQSTLITNNNNSIQTNLGLISTNTASIRSMEIGLAQSMAMSALVAPSYGKTNFSIATGNYNGTNAIAYGLSHHDEKNNIVYRLIGSRAANISSSAASVGWSF